MRTLAKLSRCALASVLILTTPLAFATPVVFEYRGVCIDGHDNNSNFQCSNAGLNNYGLVYGSIAVDSSALADSIVTGEEIRNLGAFDFTFGSVGFNPDNSILSGFAALDAHSNIVSGLFNMNNFFTAANTLTLLPGGGGAWSVRVGRRFAGGVGRYTTVPEPGALALFGVGLLGIGLARRRRTA